MRIVLQPIRLNWHYVIWYRNLTVFTMSLVTPFVLLAYWNFNTLSVMLRRRRLRNRPSIALEADLLTHMREEPIDNPNSNVTQQATAFVALYALNTGERAIITRRDSRSDQGTGYN